MRTLWAGVLALVLALAAFGPTADAADGKFELYGHISHAQISATIKHAGGGEEKLSSPGYGIQIGGRYWLRDSFAVGLAADWVQDRATSAGQTLFDYHQTGFLATLSYKFAETDRMALLGTAGVGPFTSKVQSDMAADKDEFPSTIGFLVGLDLRAKITDRASLTGQLGYRTVGFKESKTTGNKINVNAFTLGVGLAYNF